MGLYQLNKTVLRITNNPTKLLQGITSNILDAPQNAFLDRFGKIVAIMDQLKINDDEILLIVASPYLQQLYTHLKPYIQLSETKIQSTQYVVYFDLDGTYTPKENEYTIKQKKGQLIVTKQKLEGSVSGDEFTLFRLKNNIPLHGIDYNNEMILNVSSDFVSFTKGCFLGQEVVARVHNLGKPPRKLTVKYEDEVDESLRKTMTSKCIDNENGKMRGFVFVRNN